MIKRLKFKKMHGLGNDFVILDFRAGEGVPDQPVLAAMTDRKTGIGCDQLIVLEPARNTKADCFMRIFNAPDASEAEACGNATRCVASLVMQEKDKATAIIQTLADLLECRAQNDDKTLIEVDMGRPSFDWRDIPLDSEHDTMALPLEAGHLKHPVAVNVGNPHAVFFVEDVESVPVSDVGPTFETDPIFPKKANIEFAKVLDRGTVRMRVWERDTGETDACGTAACATMVAACRKGFVDRVCDVLLNGGALNFHWKEDNGHLLMTGPSSFVFDGVYEYRV